MPPARWLSCACFCAFWRICSSISEKPDADDDWFARSLEEAGEGTGEGGGRAQALAKEAEEIAKQIERQGLDPATLDRQQRLYRKLLDAGRAMEQDERDETGKREATSAKDGERFTPGATVNGRPAAKFREPTWAELRGLSPEERRLVLEYFKRINATP